MTSRYQGFNLTAELIAIKRRKLELKRARVRILSNYGLLAYRPHPKQDAFHRAGSIKRRMVRAGNRFGKSLMGGAEDCAFLLGERPWYPENDPARKAGIPDHPTKGLVITTDFDVVGDVWTNQGGKPGKIWQLLPPDSVLRTHRNSSGVIDQIHLKRGSSLYFDTVKAFENDKMSQESKDWDFIHVDEPCPQKMWKAASRGLIDRNGPAWFTLTPIREQWINDMFFPRRRQEIADKAIQEGSKWAVQGSMHDNPYLSEEAKKLYLDELTKDERQCREMGIPLHLSGMVYKQFDYDRHVLTKLPGGWTAFNKPPKDYIVHVRIDTHPQTPHAVLFAAISPHQQIFLWEEIFEQIMIGDLARRIQDTYAGYYVGSIKCDPMAWINDPITNYNISDEFAKHGLLVEKATKDLRTGIMKTQEALSMPNRIYVSPYLDTFIWEIERYCWEEEENKPVDENDHFMENFYRLVIDDPKWFDISTISNVVVEDEVIDKPNYDLNDLEEV